MQTTYLFFIQTDHTDEAIPCLPQASGEPGLGLTAEGISWKDQHCDVKLEIRNNEPYISKNTESNSGIAPILERNGRTKALRDEKPVRLLPEDTVQINQQRFSIAKILKSVSSQWDTLQNSLKTAGKQKMFATAAALLLSMSAIPITACNLNNKTCKDINPSFTSGVPEFRDPWEGLTGQERLDICQSMQGNDKARCCNETQSDEPQFRCTYNAVDPKDNPRCESLDDSELKTCCDAMPDNDENKEACCERLNTNTSGRFTCEETTIVPPATGGVPMPPPDEMNEEKPDSE